MRAIVFDVDRSKIKPRQATAKPANKNGALVFNRSDMMPENKTLKKAHVYGIIVKSWVRTINLSVIAHRGQAIDPTWTKAKTADECWKKVPNNSNAKNRRHLTYCE